MEVGELTAKELLSMATFDMIMDSPSLIEREILIQQCIDRAEELGVKTKFANLVKAFKAEEKRLQKQMQDDKKSQNINNEVDYSDIDEKLYCGSWIADDMGVRRLTDRGVVVACPHPITILARYINIQTGKEKVRLKFKKRFNWKEIVIEKNVISSASKIVALSDYGVAVTSENAKLLVAFLSDIENMNIESIEEKNSTSKLGWINGKFIPYDVSVQFDNEDKLKSVYESIGTRGDENVWYSLARSIKNNSRLEPKIYFAASFASVLIEPLNALPFIVNLWGETGKGKTVALMLAASVWAYPGNDGYIPKAKGTEASLEVRLDFLNNFPLMFDDLSQLKDKYKEDFSEFVYMLCSGRSKERSNKELGLNRAATWKNIILTNSEHSLVSETMQGGAINRIIDVEMADGYIFENGNEVVQILDKNYGFAGREFMEAITELGFDKIKEMQQVFFEKIKNRASELGVEKEEKQMIPMSILLTADKISADHVFKDGIYLDFNECFELIKDKDSVSEHERAYEFIKSEISINNGYFQHEGVKNGKFEVQRAINNQTWGVITEEYIIIQQNIFKKMCQDANCSFKAFLSWLKRKNLVTTENGRMTKVKKINGENSRCIWLRKPEFTEFVEVDQMEIPFD